MAERNDERIDPVALPAGQFELSELDKAIDQAVSVKDREKHPERINKAIVDTIKNPELLANLDRPAIPTGAEIVEQPIAYREGDEPVMRDAVAFKKADADSGHEASKMRYEERAGEMVVTDLPAGAPVEGEADLPPTIVERAQDRVEDETDTTASKRGGGNK